ncbi:PTS sugar transporter subunit IIA, partial [Enterococcus hirae]|nr:PTS sugar transporter subunit IIA [Enterococcus hirae]MCD4950562.1 PTS sugar transporter subunit IIA [Enterococcus hirae]MCD5144477.1 PTS sugar transporter subunit IIA [Enterococcus hirae]
MLALKEPHAQLEMLQKLITMFQKKEVVQKLRAVNNTEEYYQIIEKEGFV